LGGSRAFEPTAELAASAAEPGSVNLRPSVDFRGSAAVGETGGFGETQGHESEALKGTQGFEATDGHPASQAFSASALFTNRDAVYQGHRPLINLSGYLFFVFFYGDLE
jgi:hypothetical protein